ncbi:uncharacterized protein G2W53_033828 [Senna tora]|uniref:Uncharacterized protein n=1 Tax=Senna tora TaxID=362788 RepID=A0A834T2Z1_9FABA|nr:uncharacterized protein G2W53_033828 [Senna tora]
MKHKALKEDHYNSSKSNHRPSCSVHHRFIGHCSVHYQEESIE